MKKGQMKSKKGQVKFSGFVMILVMVMAVFTGTAIIVNDFQKAYVDTNITSPEGDFDDEDLLQHTPSVDKINDTLRGEGSIGKTFDKISSDEGYLRIEGVLEFIPVMLISAIKLFPVFFGFATDSIYSLFQTIIPGTAASDKEAGVDGILVLISLGLLVWLSFKALEAFRRYPT